LLFAIHGAGQEHFTGMESNIRRWGTDRVLDHPGGAVSSADANRVIIVAPAFERIYYPQSPEDQRPVKDLALEFLAYEASGSFPPGYLYPDAYLYDFVCLLKTYARYRDAPDVRFPNARCDTKLNEIFDAFRAFFSDVDQERFNLVGYSGGGQFVNRFATLYPDKLNRIAFGGAGSLLFPFFTVTYPYGLICSYDDVDWVEIWGNRHQDAPYIYGLDNFFRRHGWGDWAPDLVRITPWDWHLRLATLLQRKVFVYAGEFDFVGDDVTSPLYREPFWQGLGQYEKAKNFVKEMGVFDRYLKRIGMRKDWEPFQVVLNEGIEDAGLGHTDMDTAMYEWLRRHWWDCG
jgi:pimeloyl-ACP methyl ester carboxylesterase